MRNSFISQLRANQGLALALAVGCSALTFLAHNLREFGPAGLLALETATLPVLALLAALLAAWWLRPGWRAALATITLSHMMILCT